MGERYNMETPFGVKGLHRVLQRVASHTHAFEVGSYFLQGYYNVLANCPERAFEFYKGGSTAVRLDCQTMKSSIAGTVQEINDMIISMNIRKVEVKTANFVESWGGAIQMLVTGLVQLKDYPIRKRFAQTMLLAPQDNGYFVFSDIFKLICDEYDYYEVADYNRTDNITQIDAHNTMTETASDCMLEDFEAKEAFASVDFEERDPASMPDYQEVQQQDTLDYGAVIDDNSPSEEPTPLLLSSTDCKQDAPLDHIVHPSTLTPEEEPMGEPAKQTYASVLRTKGHPSHQAMMRTVESQQNGQMTKQVQPVHEKSNLDTHHDASVPEDDEFLSVYVGNLSPSTSVFDLEKVFQAFGKIRPDGVAIRSRKEAGVFFGFVEYEDMSGIQNALSASPIELNGRLVHVEERRPNSGIYRGGGARRGRGRAADFSRGQSGGRYDGDYATRSKGNGYQRRG
ncbi:nuclear transport factor 2-like isoform X2 [Oryza brachyantha]|uniref:nuclear transport factor 2-like isoform X2 n=1 Tax=Oryza brachyantha TaxID=4533 RepID=UPI001ADD2B25|nr:nuclear transport factor 2-like isoform X2 [Oryza brachyantha]